MQRIPISLLFITVVLLSGTTFAFYAGTLLSSPALRPIGTPPPDLPVTPIEFSGLKGWFIPTTSEAPCIVLMHGVRADRRSMVERARMLYREGYSTLLFDFQAHGESPGKQITFGFLESDNAAAAVETARTKFGCRMVAAIGQSLGGAAALLGKHPLDVDALIIESVYSTIDDAVANRLKMRFGQAGSLATPLLTLQLKYRMHIATETLRPVDAVSRFSKPILIITGTEDRHTSIEEARALFNAANEPKQFWAAPGAAHVDIYRFSPQQYMEHVLPFLTMNLYIRSGEEAQQGITGAGKI